MVTTARQWIAGARPKTLPAGAVPVAVGTAIAVDPTYGWDGGIIWWRSIAAMVVSLALQVATNYANDYSDGVRGTDDDRTGPMRLVGSGAAQPSAVKAAAMIAFAVAGLAGLTLAIAVGWPLLVVGAVSMLAGWFYTGGSNPYGYLGLGELFVFVFFGLVATVFSAYVQPQGWSALAWLAAVAVGSLATALMVTNNLRDIPTDAATGKNTLAVRIGDGRTRSLFVTLMVVPFVVAAIVALSRPWAWLAFGAAVPAFAAIKPVLAGAKGRDLIAVLGATARTQWVYGAGLSIGLWVG